MCRKAGFTKKQAKIAAAIALCESAPSVATDEPMADFDAVGDQDLANTTWGYSYGGFQIRSLREQKGTGGVRDEDELLRPAFNCRSALAIRQDSGWKAWSTYTSGCYKAYLQDLYPPEPGTYIVVAGDTLSGIADKVGGFTWQDLARVNSLHSPYTLHIGQVLTLPTREGG